MRDEPERITGEDVPAGDPPAAAVTKAADACADVATSRKVQVLSHWHGEARQLLSGPEGLGHYSSAPAIYTAGGQAEEEDTEEDVQTGAIQHLGGPRNKIPFLRMKRTREVFFFSLLVVLFLELSNDRAWVNIFSDLKQAAHI